MASDDDLREQLQRMQRQSDHVTNQSLESTRRILRTAEETQDLGVKTLVELDEQGEKLNRIEENLDTINADMKKAEKHLSKMQKFCGLCICGCKKRADFEKSDAYRKTYGDLKEDGGDGRSYKSGGGQGRGTPSDGIGGGGYIQRVTNDAREDEMEENLGLVGGIVGNLHAMATDMGMELDKQNVQLDTINDKTAMTDSRISQANRTAQKILRS